jgi:endonuclease/exonuclease/phosphatase family metal-dependent hydrolase
MPLPVTRRLCCVFLLLAVSVACAEELPKTFRVMTYNIHHGVGPDSRLDLERIAALIKTQRVDLVAFQEVDRGVARSAHRDLIAELAKLTGMQFYFDKNIDHQGGQYGNAVLSRFPIVTATNTHYQMSGAREQRGLLHVVVNIGGRKLLFMNTHLDYRRDDAERLLNIKQIKETIAKYPGLPLILCGDFNDSPATRTYERLSEFLTDAWKKVGKGNGFTIPSGTPVKRIDYIWCSGTVAPISASVPESRASDHLPVVVEFLWE